MRCCNFLILFILWTNTLKSSRERLFLFKARPEPTEAGAVEHKRAGCPGFVYLLNPREMPLGLFGSVLQSFSLRADHPFFLLLAGLNTIKPSASVSLWHLLCCSHCGLFCSLQTPMLFLLRYFYQHTLHYFDNLDNFMGDS